MPIKGETQLKSATFLVPCDISSTILRFCFERSGYPVPLEDLRKVKDGWGRREEEECEI